MPELPLVVTVDDAKNPTLLVRLLRTIADQLSTLGARIDALVSSIKIPSIASIRKALQSDGDFPLNLTNLRGIVADPQPASALRYTIAPTGLVLQNLRDTQFVIVKNGAGYDLCTVIGGNPNSLFTLIAGASGGSSMTTDTVQTVTGAKTFNAGTFILGGSGGAGQILKQATLGGAITVGTIASTNLSDTANIPLLNASQTFSNTNIFSGLVQITGGMTWAVVTVTSNVTLASFQMVAATQTNAARTINLPATPTTGEFHIVKDDTGTGAATNNITVSGNGKNIDGSASHTINTTRGAFTYIYNGTQWNIV